MDRIFQELMSNMTLICMILGIFAFVVSVITEVTKDMGVLATLPTDLQVIVSSIAICQVAYFAYCAFFSIEIQWYYIAGCFFAAFIVAYIAMYGWDKLTTLYKRFKK